MKNIKKTARFYDGESADYDAAEQSYPVQQVIDLIKWNKMQKFLKNIPPDGIILDAGGGTGKWAVKLAEKGFKVVSCDLSLGMLQKSSEKKKSLAAGKILNIVNCDIENSPFRNGCFDAIIAEGRVVSITPDSGKAVRELYRILGKNAGLWADVCNIKSTILLSIMEYGFNRKTKEIKKNRKIMLGGKIPMKLFTRKETRNLFYESFFKNVDIEGDIAVLHLLPDTVIKIVKKSVFARAFLRVENLLVRRRVFDFLWGEYIIKTHKDDSGTGLKTSGT